MNPWTIPDWPEPFNPAFEVPKLKALAEAISKAHPKITCEPSFETEGCAFVLFYRGSMLIGEACVTEHESGAPFYSAYFGADSDEFHGFSVTAIVQMIDGYDSELSLD